MFNPNTVVKRYKELGNGASVAREFGIHRSTVSRWVWRAKNISLTSIPRHTGLQRLSRRPHHLRASTLTADERIAICYLREEKHWSARRITGYLKRKERLHPDCAFSTVHRFLKKKGYIHSKRHRRPKYQDTVHMHLKNVTTLGKLQMDVKYVTPELSGLPSTVFLYSVIDIFSRWKAGIIFPVLDAQHAAKALVYCLDQLPFKADFVQTDNGLEFQAKFRDQVADLGLQHHHIHKSTPNENAVIERSFRTDEEEFFFELKQRPRNMDELHQLYQQYLVYYNTDRPHLGLDCLSPIHIVANVSTH